MKTIELKTSEAIQLESEIQHLLSIKSKVRLKYELSLIGLKLKRETEVAKELRNNIFKEYGHVNGRPDTLIIDQFEAGTTELTEGYKELQEVDNRILKIEIDNPIKKEWLDDIETDVYYAVMFEKIVE